MSVTGGVVCFVLGALLFAQALIHKHLWGKHTARHAKNLAALRQGYINDMRDMERAQRGEVSK